jgi:hypothetical protein
VRRPISRYFAVRPASSATSTVEPQPGCAVEHGVVIEHSRATDEILELSESRLVDRGLFEHGEPVVVVASGAVRPHVMKPLRQFGAMRGAQDLELALERGVLGA